MSRILAVSHDASLYGAQRSLLDAVTGLAAAGHAVDVCVPEKRDLVGRLEEQGVRVHVLPFGRWIPARPAGVLHRIRFLAGFPAGVFRALRLVRAGGYDVVYTNTVTVIEFAVAAKLAGVPHVWHLRESAAGNPQLASLLSNANVIALVRALSTRVIYNSRYLLARYDSAPTAKDVVVHNGFPPRPAEDACRDQRAAGTPIVIVTAGYMNHGKGLDVLLDALALLPGELRDRIALRVAGHLDPEEMARHLAPRLERLNARVELLGWVEDMGGIWRSADLLVSSARDESFGRTLVEAMMAGVPVLATRSGGPEEIVVDGVSGVLVPSDDPPQLCAALVRLLQEPHRLAAYGRAGREHALVHFSLAAYVHGIETCLLQAIADARARRPVPSGPGPRRS